MTRSTRKGQYRKRQSRKRQSRKRQSHKRQYRRKVSRRKVSRRKVSRRRHQRGGMMNLLAKADTTTCTDPEKMYELPNGDFIGWFGDLCFSKENMQYFSNWREAGGLESTAKSPKWTNARKVLIMTGLPASRRARRLTVCVKDNDAEKGDFGTSAFQALCGLEEIRDCRAGRWSDTGGEENEIGIWTTQMQQEQEPEPEPEPGPEPDPEPEPEPKPKPKPLWRFKARDPSQAQKWAETLNLASDIIKPDGDAKKPEPEPDLGKLWSQLEPLQKNLVKIAHAKASRASPPTSAHDPGQWWDESRKMSGSIWWRPAPDPVRRKADIAYLEAKSEVKEDDSLG